MFCSLAVLAEERNPLECLDAFGATGRNCSSCSSCTVDVFYLILHIYNIKSSSRYHGSAVGEASA